MLVSMDTSGIDALRQLQRTLKRQGVSLVLAAVNEQPLSLIRRSGFEATLGAGAIVDSVEQAREGARSTMLGDTPAPLP
jgi:SulP family sulfate permease